MLAAQVRTGTLTGQASELPVTTTSAPINQDVSVSCRIHKEETDRNYFTFIHLNFSSLALMVWIQDIAATLASFGLGLKVTRSADGMFHKSLGFILHLPLGKQPTDKPEEKVATVLEPVPAAL